MNERSLLLAIVMISDRAKFSQKYFKKKTHIALPEEDKSCILNVTFDVHSADAVIPGVVRRRRKQLLHVAVYNCTDMAAFPPARD